MSAKVKLMSCIFGIIIAFGVMIMGVFAAVQQNITMTGDVNFDIADKTLYLRDVRLQNGLNDPQSVPGFRPGYINNEFSLDLSQQDLPENTTGTFLLYFDIVNLIIDGQTKEYVAEASWTGTPVSGAEFSIQSGSEKIAAGTVPPSELSSATPISGTVILDVSVYSGTSFDLSSITLTIREPVDLSDVEYTIGENNEIIITSWGDGENVVIPGSVSIVDGKLVEGGDYKVTSIGDDAFANNTTVKTVTLPDTIKYIGSRAFRNCSNLTNVNLPEGLTEIGTNAFYNCTKLTDVVLPNTLTTLKPYAFFLCVSITGTLNIPASVESIGNSALIYLGLTTFTVDPANQNFAALDGILYNKDFTTLVAYPTSKATNDYKMLESVTTVEISAFRYATNLTGTLTLSPNLINLGQDAFFGCMNITGTLTIPATVTTMGSSPFVQCQITEFIVEEGNTHFTTVEGVLYDADVTLLIQFPAAKSVENFTIPSTVITIGGMGFIYCSGLTGTVNLPAGLKDITAYAFYNCTHLTTLTIPASVTSVGTSNTFYNMTNLKTVYIDSPTIASYLTGTGIDNTGGLLGNSSLETVYIKSDIVSSLASWFTANYTQGQTADGYTAYTKN